jgi:hypothetical protein
MKSYSENKIFDPYETQLFHRATRLVRELPDIETLRCHELTRAVGMHLHLSIEDGFYGFVDHSWLWTYRPGRVLGRIGFPNILDVYCVGALPQVRLVDGRHTQLPHVGWAYRPGPVRDDVNDEMVSRLLGLLQKIDDVTSNAP